jgi:hypothetical protein
MASCEEDSGLCVCPHCGIQTDSLKTFEFPQLVFLLFAYSYRIDRVTACPRCLRAYLARWGALSALTANIVWPVLVFPLFVSRLFSSLLNGHTSRTKSFLKKFCGGFAGVLLVLAAFVSGGAFIGLFGPVAQNFLSVFVVAATALVAFGLLAAVCEL